MATRTTAGRKKAATRKKSAAKKSTVKKSAAKKSAAKKSAAKKSAAKKAGATRKKSTRKYSRATSDNVHTELDEMKKGTLRSGRSGKKVTSRKQAIAIGLSEARASGKKVPPNPNARKKSTRKKTTRKKG
jgi:hypothetical protein